MGPSDTSVAKIYLQIEAEDELRDLRKTFQGLANDADEARAAIARALEGLKQKYGVNVDFDFNAKDLRDETTRFLAEMKLQVPVGMRPELSLGGRILRTRSEQIQAIREYSHNLQAEMGDARGRAGLLGSPVREDRREEERVARFNRQIDEARAKVVGLRQQLMSLTNVGMPHFDLSNYDEAFGDIARATAFISNAQDMETRKRQESLAILKQITAQLERAGRAQAGLVNSRGQLLNVTSGTGALRAQGSQGGAQVREDADAARRAAQEVAAAQGEANNLLGIIERSSQRLIALREQFIQITDLKMDPFDMGNINGAYKMIEAITNELRESTAIEPYDKQRSLTVLRQMLKLLNDAGIAELRLKGAADSTNAEFQEHQRQLGQTLAAASKVGGEVERRMQRSTLASYSLLRVIQDMPYGMLGMANNIQEVATQIAVAKQRAAELNQPLTTTQALTTMIAGLFSGGMGIATAIAFATILLQNLDKIDDVARAIGANLGLVERKYGDLKKAREDAFSDVSGQVPYEQLTADELKDLGEAASQAANQLNRELNLTSGNTGPMLQDLSEGFRDLHNNVNAFFSQRWATYRTEVQATENRLDALQTIAAEANEKFAQRQVLDEYARGTYNIGDAAQYAFNKLRNLRRELEAAERELTIRTAERRAQAALIRDDAARAAADAVIDADEVFLQRVQQGEQEILDERQRQVERGEEFTQVEADAIRARYLALGQAESDAARANAARAIERINEREGKEAGAAQRAADARREREERNENIIAAAEIEAMHAGWTRIKAEIDAEYVRRLNSVAQHAKNTEAATIAVNTAHQNAISRAFIAEQQRLAREESERMIAVRDAEMRRVESETNLRGIFDDIKANLHRAEEENRLAASRNELADATTRLQAAERARNVYVQQYGEDQTEAYNKLTEDLQIATDNQATAQNQLNLTEREIGRARVVQALAVAEERKQIERNMVTYLREKAAEYHASEIEIDERRADNDRNTLRRELSMIELRRERAEMEENLRYDEEVEKLELRKASQAELEDAARQHEARLSEIQTRGAQERIDANRAYWREVMNGAVESISNFSQAYQTLYDTWREGRERELEEMGVGEEERNAILDKEGRKRFNIMKGLRIAEAIANTISASISSFESGVKLGGPVGLPLGIAMATATGLAGMAMVHQLTKLTPDGGGGSGAGFSPGAGGGAYTVLNAGIAQDRRENFATINSLENGLRSRNVDRFERAITRFEEAAANVRMSERTAAAYQNIGSNFNERYDR